MIGKTLAHFEILAKLGEGGMGVVYLARDTRLGRSVAIKVLAAHLDLTGERRQRFLREARIVSTLNHPNIVTLYDIGEHDGQDFLVMEHVDGRTLDQLIGRRGVTVSQAVQYGRAIAEAMTRAHAAGVLHRDLKPSNVIVATDGTVKVLDFGLARIPESAPDDAATVTASPALSREGAVSGTPAYMSPEQAAGERVDARSDIFSFGALMYELVTGVRAFHGTSSAAAIAAVLREDPKPLSSIGLDVPAALDTLIQRCLRKDPATRVQTMADACAVLKELEDAATRPTAIATTRRPTWVWWLSGAAVVTLAAFGGWTLWQSRRTGDPSVGTLAVVPLTATFAIAENLPALSPDGSQVAYQARRTGESGSHIYLQVADASATAVQLTSTPASDIWPAWSPDGRWIAFTRVQPDGRRQTIRRPPVGGTETVVLEETCQWLAWTPDSRSIVCSGDVRAIRGLRMFSSDGGEGRELTSPAEGFSDAFPAVSRDGLRLVFVRAARNTEVRDLFELTLDRGGRAVGEPRLVRKFALFAGYMTWAGPRELLLSARNDDDTMRLARLRMDREPAELVWLDLPEGDLFRPALSLSSGRLAYARYTADSEIRRARSGVVERHPVTSNRSDRGAKFSPDGARVAFLSSRSGHWEVWLADAEGSNLIQLTNVGGVDGVSWSGDGTFLVFSRVETSALSTIYSVAATGGPPRRLTDGTYSDASPNVSRDGRRIYFSSNRSGRREVYRMALDGRDVAVMTDGGGDMPQETFDGKNIVFVRTAGSLRGAGPLWLVPVAGGDARRLPISSGGAFAVGKEGVYVSPLTGAQSVVVCDPVTGIVRTIPNVTAGSMLSSVSPDGLTVLFTGAREPQADLMIVNHFR